ncbi:MAG: NAD-dependent epimerase/dehydratase family protein, partial [Betaproteobacteria bacterium]
MVLITGASGFVGGALAQYLRQFYSVRALVRRSHSSSSIEYISGFDLSREIDLGDAFAGVEVVVHCAARVHVMNETALDPLEEFRQINVLGTINLATQAAQSGVKRFIYLSSVKVNGESTKIGKPFRPEDAPNPSDPYGISKFEAELALKDLAVKMGMELVIIRLPLVYGHGVKANFAALIRLVGLGVPLPFGLANQNRRSFVAMDNLLSFIKACI